MNPEQQRIAIAEACGYYKDNQYWCVRTGNGVVCTFEPPDYLNDLNAMHHAENYRNDLLIKWEEYRTRLCVLTSRSYKVPERATASQRAEAFLKTLDLWKK